jgi:hypothetical protein
MNKGIVIGVVGVVVLVAVVAVGWYLLSPLFINDSVDEAFPFDVPSEAQIEVMSEDERSELEADFKEAVPSAAQVSALSPQDQEAVEEKVVVAAATVMMDKPMDDDMMPAEDEWMVVGEGQFAGADSFHMGSGRAAVFEQGGQRVLRLEDFSVTNGPDLHVILTKESDPSGQPEVGEEYIDLGALKGNVGNQNYEIPAGVDLSTYSGVVIYCVPFHVVFATATLG